jgi:hypothetical protein
VEMTTAYDEQGHPRPTLSAIWRKRREGTDGPLSTGGELSSLQRTDADSPP